MNKGFTLLELLIVMALVVILSTVGLLSLVGFRSQQSLRLAGQNLVTVLRDTQQKSVSQEGGQQWGVRIVHQVGGRDYYAVLSGGAETARTTFPSNVEFAASYPDLTFAKISGLPSAPATFIIRLVSEPTSSVTINVNAQGVIQ